MLAEDHRSGAFEHEEGWTAPEEGATLELDTDLEESPHELDDNFDNLVARYFGDVRQFALLSRSEEQALWCRIESAHKRERRALYTAPLALPTLKELWSQVERGDIPLEHVLHEAEGLASRQGDLRQQLGDAVLELQVTPQITSADTIILDIQVNNDSLDFGRQVNGIPSIITQAATTQVLVDDGSTTVIGGVFVNTQQTQEQYVPLLHRIPFLGYLFKNKETDSRNEELLIFLTPRIRKDTV